MKSSEKSLEDLLTLKRHERPQEGYWEDFISEFHRRQRLQEVPQSAIAGWWQSLASWFEAVGPSKWAYGAGLAYAGLMVAFLVSPRGVDHESAPATPVRYEVMPKSEDVPALEQLDQLDLSPSTQGSEGERVF